MDSARNRVVTASADHAARGAGIVQACLGKSAAPILPDRAQDAGGRVTAEFMRSAISIAARWSHM